MKTIIVRIEKYCSFSNDFICLDEDGLMILNISDMESISLDARLSMVGKTYRLVGRFGDNGNAFFATEYKEVEVKQNSYKVELTDSELSTIQVGIDKVVIEYQKILGRDIILKKDADTLNAKIEKVINLKRKLADIF